MVVFPPPAAPFHPHLRHSLDCMWRNPLAHPSRVFLEKLMMLAFRSPPPSPTGPHYPLVIGTKERGGMLAKAMTVMTLKILAVVQHHHHPHHRLHVHLATPMALTVTVVTAVPVIEDARRGTVTSPTRGSW